MEYAAHKLSTTSAQITDLKYSDWVKEGSIAGLLAGISFIFFQIIAGWIAAGNFLMPLRMIAATIMGENAFGSQESLVSIFFIGALIHLTYSILAGLLFAILMAIMSPYFYNRSLIISSGFSYGLVMWLINYYWISPVANWDWFPERADPFWQGFVAHTVFYGIVLGVYIDRVNESRIEAGSHKNRPTGISNL